MYSSTTFLTAVLLILPSFVHPDKLADLFELVAKQLRFNKNDEVDPNSYGCTYESITLPCIQRPYSTNDVDDKTVSNTSIFMHVTIMVYLLKLLIYILLYLICVIIQSVSN